MKYIYLIAFISILFSCTNEDQGKGRRTEVEPVEKDTVKIIKPVTVK